MGAITAQAQHHHRSTTKSPHRPFKSRHSTKGTLKDLAKGKVERGMNSSRKTRHQQIMSKIERRHQARQKQQAKHKQHVQSTSVFSGRKGAPRIVALVPLANGCESKVSVQALNKSLDIQTDVEDAVPNFVEVDRFKQKLQYIPVSRDLTTVLDSCRVADFVIFILSATEEVDPQGELLLRAVESQGVSNVITVVQNLEAVQPAKKRTQVSASLKSFITHFFPGQDKVHSLDSAQECLNVVRLLCTSTPRGVRWRENRSWMLVDEVVSWKSEPGTDSEEKSDLVIRGTIRGKGLKANRLLQLGDLGTYQIDRIVAAPTTRGQKRKAGEMAVDAQGDVEVLEVPDADQDDVAELAPEEVDMEGGQLGAMSEAPTERKGVLLDDHHYFSDDDPQPIRRPKRLPKGTSDYQAAWYLDDVSYSGSDLESEDEELAEEEDEDDAAEDEELGSEVMNEATEGALSEYPQSEMFIDRSLDEEADELAEYRKGRKNDAEDDLEFPDEIELHPNVLARERLARYRGLKSVRTSVWDTAEDVGHEPPEWNRLLDIRDYRGAKARALGEALLGGVPAGQRVDIHLRSVPKSVQDIAARSNFLIAFSLLRHEQKMTVTNAAITLDSEYPVPIKSKEELVIQCGPRRFVVNPLFSATGTSTNNVHKFDRYLHPGRTSIATFTAPLTWGAVPVVVFRRAKPLEGAHDSGAANGRVELLEMVGTGTLQAPDKSRVVAKRVILTGHPYKIHKKVVTVRYMFFNKDDVRWFKALQLWTRRGRSGFIKESLGTHGYFKANFDAKINPQDSVAVSLYKRVFPRATKPWSPHGGAIEMSPNDMERRELMAVE